ncbi:putative lipoprotein [Leadbettera azotonutricia ZAS-9]|uniref:Putative lipoprotein n=2 Tax=Leadbettera azotonutricia TaxID=150829 RepID=F5YFG0_LEAAZ|nr:putative lipoprotein [Leadbettera azotonutricia ZAS-9]
MRKALILLPLALIFWSCAIISNRPTEGKAETAAASPRAAIRPGRVEDNLGKPTFKGLPQEAREYLETLSKAFREKNLDFLISQGEIHYENETRFRYDEETYLAMLYRIGPYTEDSPFREMKLPRLEYKEVTGIEYTAWDEKGPMIEIQAQLVYQKGETIPCEIMLVWKLPAPKVLGMYP